MHAFILAGGFATRLWPLTEKRAKPLLPLKGKPIISYLLDAIPSEISVTVSTNRVFQVEFQQWKVDRHRNNLEILIEDTGNDDQKLGALGATAKWIEEQNIQEDILLLTGDNYCGFDLHQFIAACRNSSSPFLAVHDIGDKRLAKAYGTVVLESKTKTILEFEEKPEHPKSSHISTGVSFIPQSQLATLVHFAKKHPDNIGGIFEEFSRQKITVYAFVSDKPWFDIGSFESYLEATKALVGNNLLMEDDSQWENSEHESSVYIDHHCVVRNAKLTDVVLFEDCTVEDCVLESCVLDRGCTLKGIELTGKMLREGTNLRRE